MEDFKIEHDYFKVQFAQNKSAKHESEENNSLSMRFEEMSSAVKFNDLGASESNQSGQLLESSERKYSSDVFE